MCSSPGHDALIRRIDDSKAGGAGGSTASDAGSWSRPARAGAARAWLTRPLLITAAASLGLSLLVAAGSTGEPEAQGSGDSALRIVEQYNRRDVGPQASREVVLTVRTDGEIRDRYRILNFWRVDAESCRAVFHLMSPAALKGTSYLVRELRGRIDGFDIWLYLPTSSGVLPVDSWRRGQFLLGSDFTYGDLAKWIPTDGLSFRLEPSREVDGAECPVVVATAGSTESQRALGWHRARFLIDTESWVLRRAEYLGPGDEQPSRVFRAEGLHKVDGVWTERRMSITREQGRFESVLELVEADYGHQIDPRTLQPEALPGLTRLLEQGSAESKGSR